MKMKNKREEQIQKKKEHKEALQAAKRRRREPSLKRSKPTKEKKQTILIVCEGGNTEPSYFKQFKLSTAVIETVGEGYNTITLIDRAIQLAQEADYDQIWCVFDKDDFPSANFNNAVFKAQAKGFKVAYSNQAFEYWLILHFEDHQGGAMHRNLYAQKLKAYLQAFGVIYDSDSKIVSEAFFEVLQSKIAVTNDIRQNIACKRAERNLEHHNHSNPAQAESSTTVHQLVREIEKYK